MSAEGWTVEGFCPQGHYGRIPLEVIMSGKLRAFACPYCEQALVDAMNKALKLSRRERRRQEKLLRQLGGQAGTPEPPKQDA